MFTDNEYQNIAKMLSEQDVQEMNQKFDIPDFIDERQKVEFEACVTTWKTINKMQEIKQFDTEKAWNKLHNRLTNDKLIDLANPEKKIITLKKVLSVAATVVLLVGITTLLLWHRQPGQAIFIVNNLAEPQKVELPDGSKVYLNKDAQISYFPTYNQSQRNIKLVGEAFFEVEHNPQKPFYVECNQTSVKVLGTSFNVNASASTTEVIVKTGRVEFFKNLEKELNVVLLPGEKGFYKNDDIIKTDNEKLNFLGWKDHKLIFKAMPLQAVITDINYAYHCQVEIGDSSINNLLITTTFNNISLDEIMKSISLAFNLKTVKQSESHYILLK